MSAPWSLETAGQRVVVHDLADGYDRALQHAAGLGGEIDRAPATAPHVRLIVEGNRHPFDHARFRPVTRGVWADNSGDTLVDSAGGSGFSQLWSVRDDTVTVRSRWTPTRTELAAARLLRPRFAQLRAQVLLHYPALWSALLHGMVPLHVSVVDVEGVGVLLAGPGGVGKSTLVARELCAGARATCDNLAASDGVTAYGLSEPLRLPADLAMPRRMPHAPVTTRSGGATTHGRKESSWLDRPAALRPDVVVVVRRGTGSVPQVDSVDAGTAARHLVAGTMCAGELRRFWPLTAALCLGTGRGPAHVPVQPTAEQLAATLPCYQLVLGRDRHDDTGQSLRSLLGPEVLAARRAHA